jgi:hypothetical protein
MSRIGSLAQSLVAFGLLAGVSGCGSSNNPGGTTSMGGTGGVTQPTGTSGGQSGSSTTGTRNSGGQGGSNTGGVTNSGGQGGSNTGGATNGGGQGGSNTGGATNGGGQGGSNTGGIASTGGQNGSNTGGIASTGGRSGANTGGIASSGGRSSSNTGGTTNNGGNASGGATAGNAGTGGGSTGGATAQCIVPMDASTRREAAYPTITASAAGCGSWVLEDNVCCAQYCSNDNTSESCDKCGGAGSAQCTAVNSKACVSGQWPEVHCAGDNEPWHYSRSTHFGFTDHAACQFGYYGLCTTSDKFTFSGDYKTKCDAFCKAYPDLCADPAGISLRGNFAAPQGNYYTQFWPSLDGDRDNYLSCGECFEIARTKQDGTEYQPGETGYTPPIVVQIVDSCPCSANSKWCCGSGRDHCGEIVSGSTNFKYGCPLPPGNLPANHEPQTDESIHFDLGDVAMARLQSGDPNKSPVDGVIPTKYKRIPCPVVGNIYVRLTDAGDYYFALAVVNAADLGSIVKVEAQLKSGQWATLVRDQNYTSSRPQERTGQWVVKQGDGPFQLPMSLRFTDPAGRVLTAAGAIKAWPSVSQQDGYYIDTGVQF